MKVINLDSKVELKVFESVQEAPLLLSLHFADGELGGEKFDVSQSGTTFIIHFNDGKRGQFNVSDMLQEAIRKIAEEK